MDKDIKEKWVKALRSGEYQQHRFSMQNANGTAFCCIGVLREMLRKIDHELATDPFKALGAIRPYPLIRMNDDEKKSFAEIADYIEGK